MKFEGYVQTDGISLSVIIEKPQLFKQRKRKRENQPRQQSECFCNNIPELKHEKVFIDPNVDENSDISSKYGISGMR